MKNILLITMAFALNVHAQIGTVQPGIGTRNPNPGGGGSCAGCARTVTLLHTFGSGGGTFSYNHGLGTLYPVVTCWDKTNSDTIAYRRKALDMNNTAITTVAAGLLTCTFAGGQ